MVWEYDPEASPATSWQDLFQQEDKTTDPLAPNKNWMGSAEQQYPTTVGVETAPTTDINQWRYRGTFPTVSENAPSWFSQAANNNLFQSLALRDRAKGSTAWQYEPYTGDVLRDTNNLYTVGNEIGFPTFESNLFTNNTTIPEQYRGDRWYGLYNPTTNQTRYEYRDEGLTGLAEVLQAAAIVGGGAMALGGAFGFNPLGDLMGNLGFGDFGGLGNLFGGNNGGWLNSLGESAGNMFGGSSGYAMGPDAWSFGPGNMLDGVSGWDFGPGTIGDPTLAGDFMRDTMGLNPWDYGPGNIGDYSTGWDFGPGNIGDSTLSGDFTRELFNNPEFKDWFSGYTDFMNSPAPVSPTIDLNQVPGMSKMESATPTGFDINRQGADIGFDNLDTGGTLSQNPQEALRATLDNEVAAGRMTRAQANRAMATAASSGSTNGILGRLMNNPLSSIFRMGQGLYAGNANTERANDMRNLLEEYSGRLDPFGSQRPQYQQRLAGLFTPQGQQQSFNEWMQGAGGTLRDQTMARLAASGRRANPGALTSRLHREYMANLGNERNLLSNLAGAQFGPGAIANLATTLGPRTSDAGAYSPLFGALGSIFGSAMGNTSLSDIFG